MFQVVASFTAETFSPELCLVCPELRAHALALLDEEVAESAFEPLPPIAVRAAVYVAERVARTAAEGVVLAAAVAAFAFLSSAG